jgi:outer membrane protein OmpA-like peptidoglycan-associated protein
MKVFRALLLGGACGVGVLTYLSVVNISLAASAIKEPGSDLRAILIADNSSTPAWAAPATMNPDYKKDEAAAPAASATEEAAPPATGGEATTSNYGGTESPQNPAWAAPATMNSDYQPGATPAAAGAEPAGNSADASAQPAQQPAWAAPATMNPDYKKGESAAPAAAAAAEAAPPATGGAATTSYFGGEQSSQNPAWAAPATMNPDYSHSAAAPAAQPAATATQPATASRDTAVESCREALDSDAGSARLYFVGSSYDVSAHDRSALRKIAEIVKGCGNVVVEVGGHTDNTGKPASNKRLSTLRAKAVVAYLESEGVDAAKLKAVGYGQERPITTNSTAEGRRLNRRIEFFVTSR